MRLFGYSGYFTGKQFGDSLAGLVGVIVPGCLLFGAGLLAVKTDK